MANDMKKANEGSPPVAWLGKEIVYKIHGNTDMQLAAMG